MESLEKHGKTVVETLQKATNHELYQYTQQSLLVAAPVAMILSPTFLNIPVDFGLGVVIPVHMHMGMSGIIEDYVPKEYQGMSLTASLVLACLTGLGLFKINLCGAGIALKHFFYCAHFSKCTHDRFLDNIRLKTLRNSATSISLTVSLSLSISLPGITESGKALWREPKKKD